MNNKFNKIFLNKIGLLKKRKKDNSSILDSSNEKIDECYIDNNYPDSKPLIVLKNINLSFKTKKRKRKVIYKNLNLTIYENQNIALIGPNGAGKTTLFEILTRIRHIDSGEIIYKEHLNKQDANKYINMQSQDFVFPTGLLVKDIVQFILDLQNINLKNNPDEFSEMLEIFNLKKLWFEKASKLSGGQQQRLNLFISLLNHPKILLLDEYVTGLDIISKKNIEDFLMKYIKKYKVTLLFISHDLTGLTQFAGRYIIIKNNHIEVDLPRSKVIDIFGDITNLIKKYIN